MSSTARVVFFSGANRGIGFELTRQLSRLDYIVFAGFRNPNSSADLLKYARGNTSVRPVQIEITDWDKLTQAKEAVEKEYGHLDILINNAGINIKVHGSVNEVTWQQISDNLEVNVGGPLMATAIFYPLLLQGAEKKVIHISSMMGSIQLSNGGHTPYRISKVALNMLAKNQALEFKKDGVMVSCLHPGWVKTDMGGNRAPLTTAQSVRHLIPTIQKISMKQTGLLLNYDGKPLPY